MAARTETARSNGSNSIWKLAADDTGHVEKVVDELNLHLRCAFDGRGDARGPAAVVPDAPQKLRVEKDARKRCAKFVR